VDGFTFVMDSEVRELAGDITIDGSFGGLRIVSRLTPGSGRGSCS
jgi:hypothetical protein